LNDPESSESAKALEAKPRTRRLSRQKILAVQAGELDTPPAWSQTRSNFVDILHYLSDVGNEFLTFHK
jgi:hypothetical protein